MLERSFPELLVALKHQQPSFLILAQIFF